LNRIAGELTREDVAPGQTIDTADRFVVLLRGMASGSAGMLRPGASVGPGGGTIRPISPVTIVWCDRATYDEHIRPQTDA
jgi:hypothetical protein